MDEFMIFSSFPLFCAATATDHILLLMKMEQISMKAFPNSELFLYSFYFKLM